MLSTAISKSLCQSHFQNIQTFYPSPTSPLLPPPPSTRRSRWTSVGIAAASTVALSGIVSVLVNKRRSERRKDSSGVKMQAYENDGNFVRFEGTIKGIIVDENGLDVLYWRKLQEERASFKKQYYHNMRREDSAEEKRTTHEKKYCEYRKPPVQEVHLLKGESSGSSSSRSTRWGEIEEGHDDDVENRQQESSEVQLSLASNRSSGVGGKATETKFDAEIMEALFGYVATNRKSPSSSQTFILDPEKSQNISIVLKSLRVSHREIIDAVLHGRQGLNAETIEKLTIIAPRSEEASKIVAFNDHPARLADAESFLYQLLTTVPTAFTRLNVMLFRSNYEVEVPKLKESLQLIQSACNELTSFGGSKLLLRLLAAMLKAGNKLNADYRQDFDLTALTKLSHVKSFDEKTNLVQFVVMEAIRAEGMRRHKADKKKNTSPVPEREYLRLGLPSISTDFPYMKKAATLNYDLITKTSSASLEQVVEMRKVVEQCGDEGRFTGEMRGFVNIAELDTRAVKEEQARVMNDVVGKTLEHCKAECFKDEPLQLFVVLRDFLGMVDEARLEILNIVSSPVDGSGFQTIYRFPKLPSDFMSNT